MSYPGYPGTQGTNEFAIVRFSTIFKLIVSVSCERWLKFSCRHIFQSRNIPIMASVDFHCCTSSEGLFTHSKKRTRFSKQKVLCGFFDGFLLKTNGVLKRYTRFFGNEMPLDQYNQ